MPPQRPPFDSWHHYRNHQIDELVALAEALVAGRRRISSTTVAVEIKALYQLSAAATLYKGVPNPKPKLIAPISPETEEFLERLDAAGIGLVDVWVLGELAQLGVSQKRTPRDLLKQIGILRNVQESHKIAVKAENGADRAE